MLTSQKSANVRKSGKFSLRIISLIVAVFKFHTVSMSYNSAVSVHACHYCVLTVMCNSRSHVIAKLTSQL